MKTLHFDIHGEFITLDHLLKVCHLASSGGQAKMMVADGLVQVNGVTELRKTAKIRAGQTVTMGEVQILTAQGQNAGHGT